MQKITFNEEKHIYYCDGKQVKISVTQLLKMYGLSPDYKGVSEKVLDAKAKRGTLIHEEIENFNKHGESGFTEECLQYQKFIDTGYKCMQSEFMVGNNLVAGTIDLILEKDGELIIADIKTTSTLHKESVSWQLSIYAYLCGVNFTKGLALHFKDKKLNVVEIPLKPKSEVERLIEAFKHGKIFTPALILSDNEITTLEQAELIIKQYDMLLEKAKAKSEELKKMLIEKMKENGITKFENDNITITYVAPYEKQGIDSKKLKEEEPKIYEKYLKSSKVKESIKITLKEKK